MDQKADLAAIEEAYKALSVEFHPDNSKSGDAEKYQLVQTAYEILSNPATRADFDKLTAPVSEDVGFPAAEFVAGLGADLARRLCLMCILYYRLKYNPISPALPLRSITELMVINEMDLEFNVWYLKKRGLLSTDDKSRLLITVAGIDFVENSQPTLEMLRPVLRQEIAPEAGDMATVVTPALEDATVTPQSNADASMLPREPASAPKPAINAASIAALSKVLAKLGSSPSQPSKPHPVAAEE